MAAAALACVGCGKSSGSVAHLEGKVTLGGAELPSDATAFISFSPAPGKGETVSVPISNGRYDSPKTPMGAVKVHFEITRPTGPAKISERTGAEYRDVVNLVPASATNGLDLNVEGDKADQDFKL